MALVKVKFAPSNIAAQLYSTDDITAAQWALDNGLYREESPLFEVNGDSEDAAEDAFDLTNNPERQAQRVNVYGRGRSVSTGDIVVVGEEQWLCCSFGWKSI